MAISAALWRRGRARSPGAPAIPPGDAVVLAEAGARRLAAVAARAFGPTIGWLRGGAGRVRRLVLVALSPGRGFGTAEAWLVRWRVAMTLFTAVGMVLVVALYAGRP